MFTKVYEKIIKFIKENYLFISFLFLLPATMLYPVPYFIYSGGGVMDIDSKIVVDSEYESKGSFNLCYVSELRGTVTTYLLSKVIPSWESVKQVDISLNEKETSKDIFNRDKIFLETTNMSAVKVAYQYANKNFEINKEYNYIIYITEEADTDLKIGDDIISINGIMIKNGNIRNIINTFNNQERVIIKAIRNDKEIECYGVIKDVDGLKQIGIGVQTSYDYKTDPKVEINFKDNEAGSSGGLITTLELYNNLVKEDITNGLKIAGTGTIDNDGNIGEIGGVKYKLKGAVSSKADLFLVPNGENYEEAIKEKEKHNYNIDIVGVSTFEEALKYLRNDK